MEARTFKELHQKRTSVERVFSQLVLIARQEPPVFEASYKYCTIAHITVILVASAAIHSGPRGHPDGCKYHPRHILLDEMFLPPLMIGSLARSTK
jgi:hypothetical protein